MVKQIINPNEEKTYNFTKATADFEPALKRSIEGVFQIEIIGCLFHFKQALQRKWKSMGLLKKFKSEESQLILNNFASLCWLDDKNKISNNIEILRKEYSDFPEILKYIQYFEKQWMPLIYSKNIDYTYIENKYRSNSVLENFHSKVVASLQYNPNWKDFLEFLIKEEELFCNNCLDAELTGHKVNDSKKNYAKSEFKLKEISKEKKNLCKEAIFEENKTTISKPQVIVKNQEKDKEIAIKKTKPYEPKKVLLDFILIHFYIIL